MNPSLITSIEDPRIQAYRTLEGTPEYHKEQKIFIAEGKKITQKLLQSSLEVLSIFALPSYFQALESLISSRFFPNESLFTADKNVMNQIVGFRLHEGVMAIGKQPESIPLTSIQLPAVALTGIVNSENVGAILRNCAAFGIQSIIVDSATSSPYLRRAVRVSMGAVFGLDIFRTDSVISIISLLRSHFDCTVVSAEITANSQTLSSFKFSENSIIIFGSEGNGIHPDILGISDAIISIPILSVDSLNVAASSAIILYNYSLNI